MERYHIFKLGFAVIFYAAYCIRPMVMNELRPNSVNNRTNFIDEEYVYYQGVQGKPGVDFPVLSYIPRTTFTCRDLESGYYADVDTDCQVFHICEEGRKISFLCPNGTIFHQAELICEWWFKVNCTDSVGQYEESVELLRENTARRKASRRVFVNEISHRAVSPENSVQKESQPIKPGKNSLNAVSNQNVRNGDSRIILTARASLNGGNSEPSEAFARRMDYEQGNRQPIRVKNAKNRPSTSSIQSNNNYYQYNSSIEEGQYSSNQKPSKDIELVVNPSQNGNVQENYVSFSVSQPTNGRSRTTFRNTKNRSTSPFANHNTTPVPQQLKQDQRSQIINDLPANHRNSPVQEPKNTKSRNTSPFVNHSDSANHQQARKNQIQEQGRSKVSNDLPENHRTTPGREFEDTKSRNTSPFVNHNNAANHQQIKLNHIQDRTSKIRDDLPASQSAAPVQFVTENSRSYDLNLKGTSNAPEVEATRIPKLLSSSKSDNRGVLNPAEQNKLVAREPPRSHKNYQKENSGNFNNFGEQTGNHQSNSVTRNEEISDSVDHSEPVSRGSSGSLEKNPENGASTNKNFDHPLRNPQTSPNSDTQTKDISGAKINGGRNSIIPSRNQPKQQDPKIVSIDSNGLGPSDSDESQIPQETASFYKNSYNSIQNTYKLTSPNPYPNHHTTYSDIKEPKYYGTKIFKAISSVTPQYLTTQAINNGRPFIGSQVGTTLRASSTTKSPVQPVVQPVITNFQVSSDLFNTGTVGKNPVSTNPWIVTTVSPKVPTTRGLFNLGVQNTARAVPTSTTVKPKLELTTKKVVDHATVYGTFVKAISTTPSTLLRTRSPSSNTFYSQPIQFSESFLPKSSPANLISTTTSSTPIRNHSNYYLAESQLNRTSEQNNEIVFDLLPPKIDTTTFNTRSTPASLASFTEKYEFESTQLPTKNSVERPRPFQLSPQASTNNLGGNHKSTGSSQNSITPHSTPIYRISSASPFVVTSAPTQPTPFVPDHANLLSSRSNFENVDNMINALAEMANESDQFGDNPSRPGLVIPPSAGPNTLHTLAVYFANAVRDITSGKDEALPTTDQPPEENVTENLTQTELEKKEKLTALLTKMTMDRYNELFMENQDKSEASDSKNGTASVESRGASSADDLDLQEQHTENLAQAPRIRQLAKVFTQALSSYLDDPVTFRKVLEEVRPTEPAQLETETENPEDLENEDELLNFSDGDKKSSYPPIFPPVLPSIRPTWSYIVAYNSKNLSQNLDVKNSLNPADLENLQGADSQSFVSQFNKLKQDEERRNLAGKSTTEAPEIQLPEDHWTASPGVTNLWRSAFSFDPSSINENFGTPTEPTRKKNSTELSETEPEIHYELRSLPKLNLNSSQVHGILIDFMNSTKNDDSNSRLQRILRKLNTTEDEFLAKMKEIETNPLTRRLVLLLISECGTNSTIRTDLGIQHPKVKKNISSDQEGNLGESQPVNTRFSSSNGHSFEQKPVKSSSLFKGLVDPSLGDDSEDARALQLLNSLYSIAAKFGKK